MSSSHEIPASLRARDASPILREWEYFDASIARRYTLLRPLERVELEAVNACGAALEEAQALLVAAYRNIFKVRLPVETLHYRQAAVQLSNALLTMRELAGAHEDMMRLEQKENPFRT